MALKVLEACRVCDEPCKQEVNELVFPSAVLMSCPSSVMKKRKNKKKPATKKVKKA